MNLQCAVLAAALASVVSVSLGGTEEIYGPEVADETAEDEWEVLALDFHLPRSERTRLCQPKPCGRSATGCTSKHATIMKQSKQGRSG